MAMKNAMAFENVAAGQFDFGVLIDIPAKGRRKKRADLETALTDLDADG